LVRASDDARADTVSDKEAGTALPPKEAKGAWAKVTSPNTALPD
jgi:hypothetical protein